MPVRIYDIAKKLGLENKEILVEGQGAWALPPPRFRPARSIKSAPNGWKRKSSRPTRPSPPGSRPSRSRKNPSPRRSSRKKSSSSTRRRHPRLRRHRRWKSKPEPVIAAKVEPRCPRRAGYRTAATGGSTARAKTGGSRRSAAAARNRRSATSWSDSSNCPRARLPLVPANAIEAVTAADRRNARNQASAPARRSQEVVPANRNVGDGRQPFQRGRDGRPLPASAASQTRRAAGSRKLIAAVGRAGHHHQAADHRPRAGRCAEAEAVRHHRRADEAARHGDGQPVH